VLPKDFRYVAAWDHEVKAAPLARTIRRRSTVFYREPDRAVVALDDRRPHRPPPLPKGGAQRTRGPRRSWPEFDGGGALARRLISREIGKEAIQASA